MTNQEILAKAIEKAIAGGWKDGKEIFGDIIHKPNDPAWSDICFPEIILDHDFAKALWGEEEHGIQDYYSSKHNECSGSFWPETWEYHLQQMVIADDPIKYLGEYL